MKKFLFLTTMFGLLAISTFAQDKKPDYSGNWELDVAKSKLGDRARIESMTLTVSQTGSELKESSVTKRTPRPEGDTPQGGNGGGRPGGGGMGRGMMGGGEMNATYTLDGKEMTVQQDSPTGGQTPVKYKAGFEKDGKLKLSSSRSFNTPVGDVSITTKETWSLSADGKTLTVNRDMETPRGTNSTEMVFNKK